MSPLARQLARTLGLAIVACSGADATPDAQREAAAEAVLDAFYAWDADALGELLEGVEGASAMRYYQKWAEAAHYEVVERSPCRQSDPAILRCAVTVDDDFGAALGYQATDTFRFAFTETGSLVRTEFEGDDPLVFYALFVWIAIDRGEVLERECRDMFEGGPTPAECARAVADAATAFVEWSPFH